MREVDTQSKVKGVKIIISGCNRILNNTKELNKFTHKTYDAECGSGFYSIEDIEIAKQYALKSSINYGGHAYINFFELNVNKLIEDGITRAYFNKLDDKTIEYLTDNINGKLPEHCALKRYRNLRPVDACLKCNNDCKWNSNYIESILLDCALFDLTEIFINYYDGKIDKEELSRQVYEMLDEETGGKFKFQIVLRGEILDIDNKPYLNFIGYVPVDNI